MKDWFTLRGSLDGRSRLIITALGFLITLLFWWILAEIFSKTRPVYDESTITPMETTDSITIDSKVKLWDTALAANQKIIGQQKVYPLLPRPDYVMTAFGKLFSEDQLVSNTLHSMWLNIQGYFWAILVAVPIGLILSLFPFFQHLFARQVDALRYLPLSALTGLFIIWFGLGDPMKIAFLAVGIIVYLIPVVMQRILEVDETYVQTGTTMGANAWQKIRKVFIPSAWSYLMDDIRVLTAISWTYIIIAELLNKEKGIGSLIYTKARLGQTDRVFAILIIITLIGLFQDQFFILVDKIINPHKYYKSQSAGLQDGTIGILAIITAILLGILAGWIPAANTFFKYSSWVLALAGLFFMVSGFFKISKTSQA
jgi:NitT/TauT family transport system permease protein